MGKNSKRRRDAKKAKQQKTDSAKRALAPERGLAAHPAMAWGPMPPAHQPIPSTTTTTPRSITPAIRDFCARIDSTLEPVYLDVRPESWSVLDSCHYNAAEKVRRSGGRVQHGWLVWEWPGVMLDALFHAVWVSPDGEMQDVTPQRDGEGRILFQPDSRKVYTGTLFDNIRHPLVQDPVLEEFIRLAVQSFEIRARFHHDPNPGSQPHVTLSVPVEHYQSIMALEQRRGLLTPQLVAIGRRNA